MARLGGMSVTRDPGKSFRILWLYPPVEGSRIAWIKCS